MLQIKAANIKIPDINQEQLKQHAQSLLEQSEQILMQKMEKIQLKQSKIQALEKNFIQWAGNKEISLRQKLQKSSKIKSEHLQKIVKKCKDHKKFLGQKLKLHHTNKRKTLKQAWKKAQEFNHSISLYQKSKNISFDRGIKNMHQINKQMTQSLYIAQNNHTAENFNEQKQYLAVNYGINANSSKIYNNNASKQYWTQINKSVNVFKKLHVPKVIVQHEKKSQEKSKKKYNQKLKETIARFRMHSQQLQQNKIQLLGEKLQDIQRKRCKKIENMKKKNEESQEASVYHNEQKQDKKKVQKKNFRINSQYVVRQKRLQDWSQLNRQKRQQHQQKKFELSNEYLQNQKIRQLKTSIAKKITDSTIEKKLFYQRLLMH